MDDLDNIKLFRLQVSSGRLILILILSVGCLAVMYATVGSYFSYQERTANNELNRELGEVKGLLGETIGKLRENEKSEKAKNTVVNTAGDADIDDLCKRANRYGIACD